MILKLLRKLTFPSPAPSMTQANTRQEAIFNIFLKLIFYLK